MPPSRLTEWMATGFLHVPEVTFSLNGRYERPLGWNGWTGFISGDFSWVDDQVNKLRPTFITYREMDELFNS